jgi:hypothetical protein
MVIKHFQLQGPPKFTRIGIFGLKTHHLATQNFPYSTTRFRFIVELGKMSDLSYIKPLVEVFRETEDKPVVKLSAG